jgi:hypothetical protein
MYRFRLKQFFLMALCVLALCAVGCEKVGELTRLPPGLNQKVSDSAILVATGTLSGRNNYTGNGMVEIFQENGAYKVRLSQLNVSNGPDLRVYLSNAETASGILNLGVLARGASELVYVVPGNANPLDYPYLLIYCQAFSVTFAVASLNDVVQ